MTATWSYLYFGELACRYGDGPMAVALGCGDAGPNLGLMLGLPQVDLLRGFTWRPGLEKDPAFVARLAEHERWLDERLPAPDAVRVALHHAGTTLALDADPRPFRSGTAGAGRAQYNAGWSIPWSDTPLADAALVVRIDDAEHVLDLPFGLLLDNTRPVPAPLAAAPTVFARRWLKLHYEGVPYGGWQLGLVVATPGELEVEMYRHDVYDQRPPDITVALAALPDGRRKTAKRLAKWRPFDNMRQRAMFEMRATRPERHYVRVTISSKIGEHEVVIPSSLLARG